MKIAPYFLLLSAGAAMRSPRSQRSINWTPVSVPCESESDAYFALRDYADLIETGKRGLILNPKDSPQHYFLGAGYEGTGKPQEAIAEYRKAMENSDDPRLAVALAHAWAATGEKGKAENMLRSLEHNANAMASPYTMATIYAGLGRTTERWSRSGRPAWRSRSPQARSGLTSCWMACVPIRVFRTFFARSVSLDLEAARDRTAD